MRRITAIAFLVTISAAVASAQTPGSPRASATPAGSAAAGSLTAEFAAAANARDSARVAALYTDDAMLMPPNAATIRGRSAIQAFWQGLLDQGARDISLTLLGSSTTGTAGYEAGTYQFSMQPAGGTAAQDRGKFLVATKRGADGKWRIAYDIYNSDLPCPPAAAK